MKESDFHREFFHWIYGKPKGIARQDILTISELATLSQGDRVLDACCGNGRHSAEWLKLGFDVSAFDRSNTMVSAAQETLGPDAHRVTLAEISAMAQSSPGKFMCVTALWNSLGFEVSRAKCFENLMSLASCVDRNGWLVVDLLNYENIRIGVEVKGNINSGGRLLRRQRLSSEKLLETSWRFERRGTTPITYNLVQHLFTSSEICEFIRHEYATKRVKISEFGRSAQHTRIALQICEQPYTGDT